MGLRRPWREAAKSRFVHTVAAMGFV